MNIPVKKIAKRTMRLFVWSIAFVMAVFVFVQIAFWGAIVWVNTNSGQAFLQSVIGTQLKESGYRVEIGGFSYVFPTLLGVGRLSLYQGDDEVVSARSIRLDLDVFPLKDKILGINLDFGEVIVSQQKKTPAMPPPKEQAATAAPTPIIVPAFDLPDLYFTRFSIADIAIGKLVIKGEQDVVLSPQISGEVIFQNERLVNLGLVYTDDAAGAPNYMPRTIDITGQFNTRLSELKIDKIKVSAPIYDVNTSALATFRDGGEMSADIKTILKTVANLSPIQTRITAKNTTVFPVNIAAHGTYFDKPVSLKTNIAMDKQSVVLKGLAVEAPDMKASGHVAYNMASSIATGKISGRLEGLGAYQAFIGGGHDLSLTTFDVGLSGAQAGQAVKIDLESKGYKNKDFSLSLKNIKLDAGLVGQVFTINSLSMHDKDKGTLNGKGTYNLATQGVNLAIKANKYRALKGDLANGVINADITISGNPDSYEIGGTIAPEKIDIKIPERFSGSIPQLNVEMKSKVQAAPAPSFGKNIALNLIVDAPRQILVRGWGLDAEFGGKLEIKGRADDPKFYGDFNVIRGRYAEFGKKFKIAKAKMKFSGSIPPSPTLDILTETKAGDVLAKIAITGSVIKPDMEFSSEPALPQDEVLSRILFGSDLDSISPFQAVQLAQAMQRFTGTGGGSSFDPIGSLRAATGLDDLSIETDADGGASVGAGKYLTEKVYLEFEAGSEEGSGNANVQVELTPNITLESEIGQDASGGAGVFWKWDY